MKLKNEECEKTYHEVLFSELWERVRYTMGLKYGYMKRITKEEGRSQSGLGGKKWEH